MPSAGQPGGMYDLEKVSIRTGRPVASSSALDRVSRVNGQWVASTMTPVASTPRSMTPLIQSHLGIGRYAAGEDCSMSTWKYRQFECRGPVKHPLSGRGHVAAISQNSCPTKSSMRLSPRWGRRPPETETPISEHL